MPVLVSFEGAFTGKEMALLSLRGREEVSRPFRYELILVGIGGRFHDASADPEKLVGTKLTVIVNHGRKEDQNERRYLSGIVTEFGYAGITEPERGLDGEYLLHNHEFRNKYYAVIEPTFSLLKHRVDCRVLQKKTTPEIFAEICRLAGGVEHRLALTSQYKPWEQRIQYQESDFDFLSRLLEHDGIYYYFEHKHGEDVMVLVDDVAKLTSYEGYESVRYEPRFATRAYEEISSWSSSRKFRPASFATRAYNFETPSSIVTGASQVARRENPGKFEVFEYPADLPTAPDNAGAERIAKLRAQGLQASQLIFKAKGDIACLAAGRVFTLKDHPARSLNRKYVILSAELEIKEDGEGRVGFNTTVDLLDAEQPHRPERLTPKPRIHGTQTAVIVGGNAHDVVTDKYGRAKVQFYWDRGATVSCWARVAQGWAGQGWGSQQLPRVGQEVVVSFLDGDPDAPIVIGSVYNAVQMPPYALPDQKTRSGVKSRSLTDGTAENFNEVRFEDKKGEEEIYIHAEKNLQVVVENNQTITVGAVKKDKGDRSVTIQNDDSLNVGNDRKAAIKRDLTTTVTGKEARTVEKGRKTTVKADDEYDVTQKFTLTAGDEITLKCGIAKIVLKKDGSIEIAGKEVKVSGVVSAEVESPQTTISGNPQLDLKGTKIAVQGTGTLDLESSGVASLKGSLTKIG